MEEKRNCLLRKRQNKASKFWVDLMVAVLATALNKSFYLHIMSLLSTRQLKNNYGKQFSQAQGLACFQACLTERGNDTLLLSLDLSEMPHSTQERH